MNIQTNTTNKVKTYFVINTDSKQGNVVGHTDNLTDFFISHITEVICDRWTVAYTYLQDGDAAEKVYNLVCDANNVVQNNENTFSYVSYEGRNDLAKHIAIERLVKDSQDAEYDCFHPESENLLKKR